MAQVCGAEAVAALHQIADALRVLGLAHVMHAAAGAAVEAHTTRRLLGFGAGEFLAEALPPALSWAAAVPVRFLQDVLRDDQVLQLPFLESHYAAVRSTEQCDVSPPVARSGKAESPHMGHWMPPNVNALNLLWYHCHLLSGNGRNCGRRKAI